MNLIEICRILNYSTRLLDPQADAGKAFAMNFYAVRVAVEHPNPSDRMHDQLLAELMAWPSDVRGPDAGMSFRDALQVLGSEGLVFRLFALGQSWRIWRVVLPPNFTDAKDYERAMDTRKASQLVDIGAIMITDFVPKRRQPPRRPR